MRISLELVSDLVAKAVVRANSTLVFEPMVLK